MSQLVLAYMAGLVTVLSPCVLPMLPIVLGGALETHRFGPVALAAGLVLSFTGIGLLVAVFGFAIGLTPALMSKLAAGLLIVFGLILLSSTLQMRFAVASEAAVATFSDKVSAFSPQSLTGQFALGCMLGAVWTPCVGPTLGAAIALAAQGKDIFYAAGIMFVFAVGTVTPLVALMCGTREVIVKRKKAMTGARRWIKPALASLLVFVGVMILTGMMAKWEALLLELSPTWLVNFIYSF